MLKAVFQIHTAYSFCVLTVVHSHMENDRMNLPSQFKITSICIKMAQFLSVMLVDTIVQQLQKLIFYFLYMENSCIFKNNKIMSKIVIWDGAT